MPAGWALPLGRMARARRATHGMVLGLALASCSCSASRVAGAAPVSNVALEQQLHAQAPAAAGVNAVRVPPSSLWNTSYTGRGARVAPCDSGIAASGGLVAAAGSGGAFVLSSSGRSIETVTDVGAVEGSTRLPVDGYPAPAGASFAATVLVATARPAVIRTRPPTLIRFITQRALF